MKAFVRVTKLPNVVGRSKYISDPVRQEQVLISMATEAVQNLGWQTVAEFERRNQRSYKANNEGREVIIQLPNILETLPRKNLKDICDALALEVVGRELPFVEYAVHWNHTRTNLHMHVIFSERDLQPGSEKRYDRDVYLTEDSKVARRRADRRRDADGRELPPVHRKGELMNPVGFTAKDKSFAEHGWAAAALDRAESFFQNRLGIPIEQRSPYMLHEYHEGRGKDSRLIKAKNAHIRAYNAEIANLIQNGLGYEKVLKTLLRAAQADLRANKPPRIHAELFLHRDRGLDR